MALESGAVQTPEPKVKRHLEISPSKDMAEKHPFKGRSVSIVNDLSLQEQQYLYRKTRELKEAIRSGGDLGPYRLKNPEAAVYTIFMEDSTRTKESFRNAAEFHGMKVNVFDAKTSSFQKNETITDTIKMLCGYSIGQSIFVIRSKVEGVCKWLDEAIDDYTKQRGFPRASFINAGDGRHEHPSQELLDEFSFLEHKNWDTSSIHLALLGDLFHGRTVHSKVDGLRIYGNVEVDLVAPAELALPKMYEDRMVARGFIVRRFASIEEYLAQSKVAKIWYFTRLQLERMGDKVLEKSMELRQAVSMQRHFLPLLPPQTKFFHPLPRDSRHPTLPFWLDRSELNGWDQQSQNGYFTRIVLLGMLGGHLGSDFVDREAPKPQEPQSPRPREDSPTRLQSLLAESASDFIVEVQQPPNTVKDKVTRYLPKKARGVAVMVHVGGDEWRVDNSVLQSSAAGLAYRRSKDMNDKDGIRIATYGTTVHGIDDGDWIRVELSENQEVSSAAVGLVPISNGVVIERLAQGQSVEKIWGLMYMVRSILGLNSVGGQGVYRLPGEPESVTSGFISVPDLDIRVWDRQPLKKLAAMAPGSTLHVIKDGHIVQEYRLQVPPRIYNFRDISCKNTACVSHSGNMQHEVPSYFIRLSPDPSVWSFACKYCEHVHDFWQIWDYKYEDLSEFTL